MSSPTRRTFIGTAAATATLATGAALAAQQRKVVLGIIGPGGMGTAHLKQLCTRKDVEIAYVCDVDQNRLAAAAKHVETTTKKAAKARASQLAIVQPSRGRARTKGASQRA